MNKLPQNVDYNQIVTNLEKKTREYGLLLYQFKAAQYDVLEIRKKESRIFTCVGFCMLSERSGSPRFYHRTVGIDPVGDQLFRVHGPDHMYGRGCDPYLEEVKGYPENSIPERRIWKDLHYKAKNTKDIIETLSSLIETKLVLGKKLLKKDQSLHEMD